MTSEKRRADRFRAIADEIRMSAMTVTFAEARVSLLNLARAYEQRASKLDADETARSPTGAGCAPSLHTALSTR